MPLPPKKLSDEIVNQLRNTVAQLPPVTRSGDAQPDTTADRAAFNGHLNIALWAALATKTHRNSARALPGMLFDTGRSSAPPVPGGTSTPSSSASTAAATVRVDCDSGP
jgi:hypothetical protein